jgi:uncharacterized membrane protein
MRSLGTLGGPFSCAGSINTHRRIVGSRLTASGQDVPFLWTPEDGVQHLPTRGPIDFGFASDVNEFGQIVGGLSPEGSFIPFAALWTPSPGPLATEAPDEGAVPEVTVSPGEYRDAVAALCALGNESPSGGSKSRWAQVVWPPPLSAQRRLARTFHLPGSGPVSAGLRAKQGPAGGTAVADRNLLLRSETLT